MQAAYRNESFKQGSAVIRAIYDVRSAQADASSADTIEATMMLGMPETEILELRESK